MDIKDSNQQMNLYLLEGPQGGHDGGTFACAYTPDGVYLLSGGWDGLLRLWDAASGQQVASLQASPKPLSACAVSPEGKHFLAGSMEGLLGIWDALSHQAAFSFVAHTRPISAISFGPVHQDEYLLATASWDRQLILRKSGKEREPSRVLSGHTDIVAGCQFLPNGKQILSWSHDATLRLWDVEVGKELHVFHGHADRVLSASLSPDGHWAISAGRDGTLRLWDLVQRSELRATKPECEQRLCQFLLDGQSAIAADAAGRIVVFSVPRFEVLAELDTRLNIQCGSLSPSGEQLAFGGEDGGVYRIGIQGLEHTPLVVPASVTVSQTVSLLGRLAGSPRTKRLYRYTCPVCRHLKETTTVPKEAIDCERCRRLLRVLPLESSLA